MVRKGRLPGLAPDAPMCIASAHDPGRWLRAAAAPPTRPLAAPPDLPSLPPDECPTWRGRGRHVHRSRSVRPRVQPHPLHQDIVDAGQPGRGRGGGDRQGRSTAPASGRRTSRSSSTERPSRQTPSSNGTGVRCALLVTEGFRDILQIARQDRPKLYDWFAQRPPALVPRELTFEIRERMLHTGEVHLALDEEQAVAAIRAAARRRVSTAIAVCLLHSYANPAHERRLRELIARALPGGRGLAVLRRDPGIPRVRARQHDGRERLRDADRSPLRRPAGRSDRGNRRPGRTSTSCRATAAS